jgi:hypothetical protein
VDPTEDIHGHRSPSADGVTALEGRSRKKITDYRFSLASSTNINSVVLRQALRVYEYYRVPNIPVSMTLEFAKLFKAKHLDS